MRYARKFCYACILLNFFYISKLAPVFISGIFGLTGFAVFGSIVADYSIFTLKISRDDYDIGKQLPSCFFDFLYDPDYCL